MAIISFVLQDFVECLLQFFIYENWEGQVESQALNCFSGKKIPCEIDSVCIHGDNVSSLETARFIKRNLIENKLVLKPLNKMGKFC